MGKQLNSSDPDSDQFPYEVDFFAAKHGIPRRVAEVILHSNGPSRHQCDAAAAAYLQVMQWRQRPRPVTS
ncbi:hypothetical protein EN833_08420 [Mesorhizobium sp. M4B.F.Ca.ET.190.01.1.1]|nr:MAG: hypothetical protein EOQ27_15735 [Mesorhizobium sp.]RWX68621.1 hypothetical protein EN780_08645 [Mesorhizobium sp. M4B.F.Ca.ET.089.01.1.1]TGR13184.1 hypothetical protein EN843_08415 [Mesorhizobium sp. M4B.F.Ca.ET.200.01.1.1]TGS21395.1 hypothetical protein EN833_08420 [Mesorhizobium sp. M4B.F.Ca.ET.190.01.1.1]TGT32958.1 hypothetical protein EN815_10960 [Mesorhizobium sp. M4B.F.Ca.ET.172.01.1.1]